MGVSSILGLVFSLVMFVKSVLSVLQILIVNFLCLVVR